ncbi:hypothetical protein [Epilithonimonas sp.]|uniref:hypothetical protein n=1 Tax=Epilithonimonas sp. TaxID=2894511 RepID=UPI0028A1A75A|nr:hypothetical protein [Epilithonimonas sp.]
MKLERNIFYVLTSEIIFTILPLIVIAIVRLYQNQSELIFYNTEWVMMAIILFGQSIVKFSSGISNSKRKFRWQLVALIITSIISFGLIPSIVILIINLLSNDFNLTLYIFQIIFLVISIFTFYIIGYLGQKLMDEK